MDRSLKEVMFVLTINNMYLLQSTLYRDQSSGTDKWVHSGILREKILQPISLIFQWLLISIMGVGKTLEILGGKKCGHLLEVILRLNIEARKQTLALTKFSEGIYTIIAKHIIYSVLMFHYYMIYILNVKLSLNKETSDDIQHTSHLTLITRTTLSFFIREKTGDITDTHREHLYINISNQISYYTYFYRFQRHTEYSKRKSVYIERYWYHLPTNHSSNSYQDRSDS